MKKWIVICFTAVILVLCYVAFKPAAQQPVVASAIAPDQPSFKIALEGKYPPFEYIDSNNQLVGFNIDLSNALCKKLAMKCTIDRYEWDDLIPALQNKKADAIIATMSITDEREKLVQFTRPYAHVPAAYLANKNQHIILPVMTKERLAGKTIGVVQHTTFDDYIKSEFSNSKVSIKHYADSDALFAGLKSNEINLVFGDSAVFGEFLRDEQHAKQFAYVGNIIKQDPRLGRGEAIAVAKDANELKAKLDSALAQLIASGEYRELQYKYFVLQIM